MQNIAAKVLLFFHICNLFAQKYTNRATRHCHEWLLIGYFSPFCWVVHAHFYLPLSTPSLTMLKTNACSVLNLDCALNATKSSST